MGRDDKGLVMLTSFSEDGEQIAAFARWLRSPEIMQKIVDAMPFAGGPRSGCERRVEDVARALTILSVADDYRYPNPTDNLGYRR